MTFEIDWSRLIAFITAIIGFFAGWVIAAWDSRDRFSQKIKEAEAKAEAAIKQAKEDIENAMQAARVVNSAHADVPTASPPSLGPTLLHLWADPDGNPGLDLDGRTVSTSPLSAPDRKRLIALLNVLRPWLEGKPAAPVPVPPAPGPAPRPATLDVEAVPIPAADHLETPMPDEDDSTAPKGIVGQIDKILQERLASTPLAKRGIRLQESPSGGVIVWVGLKKYTSVDEVPDPEVQAILHAAIAEWEKKYTPGM